MKKLFTLLVSICFALLVCASCAIGNKVILPTYRYHTDYAGVYILIDSVDNTGKNSVLQVEWHNETDYEVSYAMPYQIEYKDGDEWVNIQTEDLNYAYEEITIAPQSITMEEYSTAGFDLSKTGTYRLRTNCTILTDDAQGCVLWVEFEMKNSLQVESHKVTAELDDWLHEDLKRRYKTGENVVVKIGIAHDIGFSLYMNGKALQQDPWESGRDYWQYTFTMPNEDVVLTYKTSAGVLEKPCEHTYQYNRDATGHWWNYTCGCETPSNFSQHFDEDTDGKCDDCGFELKSIGTTPDIFYSACYPSEITYQGKYYYTVQGAGVEDNVPSENVGDLLGYIIREEDVDAFTQEYPNVDYIIDPSIYDYSKNNRVAFYKVKGYDDLSLICVLEEGVYQLFEEIQNVYKVTIVDKYNEFIDKPNREYFVAGMVITIHCYPIMDADLVMYINGERIGIQKSVKTNDGDYIWEYSFTVPEEDIVVTFGMSGGM